MGSPKVPNTWRFVYILWYTQILWVLVYKFRFGRCLLWAVALCFHGKKPRLCPSADSSAANRWPSLVCLCNFIQCQIFKSFKWTTWPTGYICHKGILHGWQNLCCTCTAVAWKKKAMTAQEPRSFRVQDMQNLPAVDMSVKGCFEGFEMNTAIHTYYTWHMVMWIADLI